VLSVEVDRSYDQKSEKILSIIQEYTNEETEMRKKAKNLLLDASIEMTKLENVLVERDELETKKKSFEFNLENVFKEIEETLKSYNFSGNYGGSNVQVEMLINVLILIQSYPELIHKISKNVVILEKRIKLIRLTIDAYLNFLKLKCLSIADETTLMYELLNTKFTQLNKVKNEDGETIVEVMQGSGIEYSEIEEIKGESGFIEMMEEEFGEFKIRQNMQKRMYVKMLKVGKEKQDRYLKREETISLVSEKTRKSISPIQLLNK